MADISQLNLPDGNTYNISAVTLGSSDVGSNINPIYLNGGVPTPCSYTVKKSVPSDAVFTDTTYSSLPAQSGGTDVSLVTTGEKYTWDNAENTVMQNIIPSNSTDETTYSILLGKSGTKEAYKQNTIFTYSPYAPIFTGPLLNLIGLIGDATFKTDVVRAKTFIGIDNTVGGVEITLPHKYSTTEQVVGYWTDGSPIYEKTIEMPSYTTIGSGGSTTIPSTIWSTKAIPIDIVTYVTKTTANALVWRWVTAQINVSTGTLQIFNGRAAQMGFDTFTIQYIKLT